MIGAATGLAGGVLGAFSKNRHLNQQINAKKDQMANVDLWADQRGNEDGTQSVAWQTMLNENSRRMSRAARAADAKRAMGFDVDSAGQREQNAATSANLLASAAAAQQERNNTIKDQAFNKKMEIQSQIDELQAGKQNAMDMINAGVGGAAAGFEKGMGLEGLLKS